VVDGSQDTLVFAKLPLAKGNADVNHNECESIRRAIGYQVTELSSLLLNHEPSRTTLSAALDEAMKIADQQVRYQICEIIL
jgi:hypothetical protein